MYNKFMMAGLQRSGTIWISQLMKRNFGKTEKPYYWKCLTTLGVKDEHSSLSVHQEMFDVSRLDSIPDNVFVIGVFKDYDLWKKSVDRKPNGLYTSHDAETAGVSREVYDAWMAWAEKNVNKPNVYIRNYIDWLNNWEEHLIEIKKRTGWKPTVSRWMNVDKVPQSADFDKSNYAGVKHDVWPRPDTAPLYSEYNETRLATAYDGTGSDIGMESDDEI